MRTNGFLESACESPSKEFEYVLKKKKKKNESTL